MIVVQIREKKKLTSGEVYAYLVEFNIETGDAF